MCNEQTVSVYDLVGGHLCVAAGDGQTVYEHIASFLDRRLRVVVSFKNVRDVTPAFLNTAIGQLHGVYPEDLIEDLLVIRDLDPDDEGMLTRVVAMAHHYFRDPDLFDADVSDVLGGTEDE
jgi:uncharacterized protein DUF4325